MKYYINPLTALYLVIVLLCALVFSSAAGGQGNVTYPPKPGEPIKGVGISGTAPTYFTLVKVEAGHYTDMGSGSFISEDRILTCAHNVRDYHVGGKGKLSVQSFDGTVYRDVSVERYNGYVDLSILKINGYNGNGVHTHLRISDPVTPGSPVTSVGWVPRQSLVQLYKGVTTTKRSNGIGKGSRTGDWFIHTAKVVQGMSGGPLLNSDGDIVGVNIFTDMKSGESGSVSVERIMELLLE